MDTDNYTIGLMQQSEIDEVAILLTDAFYSNPAYSLVFEDKSNLRDGLLWLFSASLIIDNREQILTRVVKETQSGKIIGTFTLIPPEGVKMKATVYFKIGIGRFIYRFGIKAFTRMLSLDEKNKQSLAESLSGQKYYYLSMVVVDENYRGSGIGSRMIKDAINEILTTGPVGDLIGLTTQLPENVTFYTRQGFEKIDEGYVSFRERGYYNYNMKYSIR